MQLRSRCNCSAGEQYISPICQILYKPNSGRLLSNQRTLIALPTVPISMHYLCSLSSELAYRATLDLFNFEFNQPPPRYSLS
jgi:hypothetical protein